MPVRWIDDDNDMKIADTEGDKDSDCLMIDRDKDGKFRSYNDLISGSFYENWWTLLTGRFAGGFINVAIVSETFSAKNN